MVHFIGAGPGAPDLITVRGQKLLGEADIIIYAGSLVNPALLDLKKEGCVVYNSATMTLEQVIDVMKEAESKGQTVARLHTGDPCLYGAIREQIDALDALGIAHDDCPGVSSFCGAVISLGNGISDDHQRCLGDLVLFRRLGKCSNGADERLLLRPGCFVNDRCRSICRIAACNQLTGKFL